VFPNNYPVDTKLYFATDEDSLSFEWKLDDLAKQVNSLYNVDAWVNINQTVSISFSEWVNLPMLVQRAVVLRVNEIVSEREAQVNEQRRKAESRLAQENSKLTFLDTSKSSINAILNR
jgi:hypothetical protein